MRTRMRCAELFRKLGRHLPVERVEQQFLVRPVGGFDQRQGSAVVEAAVEDLVRGFISDNRFGFEETVFLLLFGVVALVQSRSEIKAKRQELADIQAQCANQRIENDSLYDMLNNSDSEYIVRRAYEDDFVLPGERVYIVRYGN